MSLAVLWQLECYHPGALFLIFGANHTSLQKAGTRVLGGIDIDQMHLSFDAFLDCAGFSGRTAYVLDRPNIESISNLLERACCEIVGRS